MRYKNKIAATSFIFLSALLIGGLPLFNLSIDKKLSFDSTILYSTDNLEKYRNYLAYKHLKHSFIKDLAVVGENNFLFLGNKHNQVLDKSSGKFRASLEEISSWTDSLLKLQQKYESKGIQFLVTIAPNKHSIYTEYLPDKYKPSTQTITDDIVQSAKSKKINLLDLRAPIKSHKNNELLYWKTDTHWNEKGAAIGFNEIIKHLNHTSKTSINIPFYSLKKGHRGGGDLANFLKINTILPTDYETNYLYSFEKKYEICKGNINKETGKIESCEPTQNPTIGINRQPQFTINSSAENDLKLLFLCDSFGTAPSQLYNATFSTVWKWHWNHIYGSKLDKFLDENLPDIVIYQIVERSLYNNTIINL